MSLNKELIRIMDLSNPYDEAKKKLVGTYMFVNGSLIQVKGFNYEDGTVSTEDPNNGDELKIIVKTLEVYLPEAGVYKHPDGYYVVIRKIPKRQWLKSYHTSFYKLDIIGELQGKFGVLEGISDKKRQDIFVSSSGNIYYWTTIIGYIKDSNTIVCTNKDFRQEIIDWDRHGHN